MSIETLDYTVNYNGHTVTCFEVGSVPTIGYASIEDAMTGTNPVTVPESVFDAACALLDQGVHLTTIYAHVGEETWMQWDETPEELTAEDILAIEGEDFIRKQAINSKQRRAARRVQNKRHKQSDRAHGKKRPMSRKDAVRANNDQAQMTRPIGMWSLYPNGACHFRPFQRSNRHNNHLSYGQEVLNMLKVASKRVTAEDVNWAKTVVQNAAEEGQEWAIHDYLAEQLDYCPTPEREVALLTVILLSWWTEQFDGYVNCGLPATEDCFDSIGHSDWYRWAVKQEVPLMVEAWKQV